MTEQTSFRLPRDLARALNRLARDRGVPKSQLVREALQAYLADPGAAGADAWDRVAPFVGSLSLDRAAVERDHLARQIRAHNWRG